MDESEYSINEKFQQDTILLSDELDTDEIDAARLLLDSEDDPAVLGRSLFECAVIRFHQQRKYLLDSLRLLLEIDYYDDDDDDSPTFEGIKLFVEARLFLSPPTGSKRYIPRCMNAMSTVRSWLQKLGDKIAAAQTLYQGNGDSFSEELETIEFSRLSLIQQHELLGVVLCRLIERRQADVSDFLDFVSVLQKTEKYDTLLRKFSLSPVRS